MTLNARRPTAALARPEVVDALVRQRERLENTRRWQVRTWVVMPDHLHVLFTLHHGGLSAAIREFKGPLATVFRRFGLRWQDGFYDHRMRHDDDRLPAFLYIFLNPYRGGLVAPGVRWAGYYCGETDRQWFDPLTQPGTAFPEWLKRTSATAKEEGATA